MRIRITQHALRPSPIPMQSCFFCGMPVVSATARALSDVESGRRLGWGCPECLDSPVDHLQHLVGAKMQRLRDDADRRYRQAEALAAQANELEQLLHGLSRSFS